jgi:hypothetical protein
VPENHQNLLFKAMDMSAFPTIFGTGKKRSPLDKASAIACLQKIIQ